METFLPTFFSMPILEWGLFFGLWFLLTPLVGTYLADVFSGERSGIARVFLPLETYSYRFTKVQIAQEMTWNLYLKELLIFNLWGFLAVFFLMLAQGFLPLNPENLSGTSVSLAFNTAISYMTNTNWQAYAGETTLSYLTQMLGLTVQNFLSAATGICVWLVLIRGFVRKPSDTPENTLGNFWVDLVRSVVYVLLPLSLLLAVCLIANGVVQSFSPYVEVTTLEGAAQTIPLGPAASQVAIKQIGTNGGGFFGVNSAHPFENPNAFSNFLENLAILILPSSMVYAFGIFIGSKKHAWILLIVMFLLYLGGLGVALYSESVVNAAMGVSPVLEGQETRFLRGAGILWTVSTTATSNGSVNAMISSLSPLSGGVALFNMMLGELMFGGIGVGFVSMVMFVLLTVFLSGLMVGRTPEYLGKKIDRHEMQLVVISVLTAGILILIGTGVSIALPVSLASIKNPGPHGLSEILYAFASAAGNNGSAFAGLNTNIPYYNWILGFVMIAARLAIVVPSIAVAGLLVRKRIVPPSRGTFSTETALFGALLLAVIIIVGTLAFFPALLLGPVVEHFLMIEGRVF